MPNATPVRPTMYIVADRRAAVAGVETVNGKAGNVTLAAADIPNSVLTVNGNAPDSSGNVKVTTSDEAPVLYIGEIMHVPATHTPVGALPCDGSLYNRTTYPDLWSQIADGTLAAVADSVWMDGDFAKFSYGTQDDGTDGTVDKGTNFRVPDLTGRIQQLDFVKLTDIDHIDQFYADQVGMYYQNTPSLALVSMGYPKDNLCGTLVVYGNGYAPVVGDTKQGANQVYYPADSSHPYTRVWIPAQDDTTAGKWSDWDQVNLASDGLWLNGKNKDFGVKIDGQFSVQSNMNTVTTDDSFFIQRYKDTNSGHTMHQIGAQGGVLSSIIFDRDAGNIGIHADGDDAAAFNTYSAGATTINSGNDVTFNISNNKSVWSNSAFISTDNTEGFQKSPNGWVDESGGVNGANQGLMIYGRDTNTYSLQDFYVLGGQYWTHRIMVGDRGNATNPLRIWEFRSTGELWSQGNIHAATDIVADGKLYQNTNQPVTTVQHVEEVHDKLLARIEALEARLAAFEGTVIK